MKNVLLLLANGFEIYEASVFIDVLGWNNEEGEGGTKLLTCGLSKHVNSSFNQTFVVDLLLEEVNVNDFEALAIPGGFESFGFYKEAFSDPFAEIIRKFYHQNKFIASICVGALPLGNSGILKGKNATTYNNPIRRSALESFGANVKNEAIVKENNIITSWNPSTAIDVSFILLENLTSKENANNVRSLMGF